MRVIPPTLLSQCPQGVREIAVGGSLWAAPSDDGRYGRGSSRFTERGFAGENLNQHVSSFAWDGFVTSYLDHDHPKCKYIGFPAMLSNTL